MEDVDAEGGSEEDSFFEMLSRFQGRRIDDQRCCSSVLEGAGVQTEEEDKENVCVQGNEVSVILSAMWITETVNVCLECFLHCNTVRCVSPLLILYIFCLPRMLAALLWLLIIGFGHKKEKIIFTYNLTKSYK